ncbi:hypothetical protein GNIT_0322 [Glaciecola nitratireducens FR1064]|uniref:Uncharacterized protein n=2 Tax=Brumicola TaxID=3160924 RepID=G4QFD2_GLANF|nr:hypothetical protein GNIT_0322 [Glaciecola nitratireducens FR1064]
MVVSDIKVAGKIPLSNTRTSVEGTVKTTQIFAQTLLYFFLYNPMIESKNQKIGKAQAKMGF